MIKHLAQTMSMMTLNNFAYLGKVVPWEDGTQQMSVRTGVESERWQTDGHTVGRYYCETPVVWLPTAAPILHTSIIQHDVTLLAALDAVGDVTG